MEPRNIKSLFHDDVIYRILLWLPVASLLRFKCVCRSWCGLIESSYFIKKHLHLHHYDPSLKDKNQNLIYLLPSKDLPITFALISIESFEESNVRLQLNCSDLHGYFAVNVLETVSYNGIICLNLFDFTRGHRICLWNPATKQSRVLSQSTFPNTARSTIGFGFDVKSNDYKVVNLNLIKRGYSGEKRAEVYSLNTSSWRSVSTDFSCSEFIVNPGMPFKNGTCFFWLGFNGPNSKGLTCFDFCSETFRHVSFPLADCSPLLRQTVLSDKIACIFRTNDRQMEIWVFNEYGTVNESWAKLYTVDPYLTIDGWLSMRGNYIYFKRMKKLCRFNVATKETNLSDIEMDEEFSKNCSTPNVLLMLVRPFNQALVEFKESLVSVGGGISAAAGLNLC